MTPQPARPIYQWDGDLRPIDAALDMSPGTIAAATAGIAIANKILILHTIAVMGKAGFATHKAKVVLFPFAQGLAETWPATSWRSS